MERKSNISGWQLKLYEGFDRDVIVMQRDEEEVFDNAIHVFIDKEYYDTYVSNATKYSTHKYAYHVDKLGEVVYQVFEENIAGIVLHIIGNDKSPKNVLYDEKYVSANDLFGLKDVADSYHYLYTASTDRCPKEQAVARLWTKYVYIIGQLPNTKNQPENGEKPVFELMTMKRKKDGQKATAEDFDYESLKVFLTADSAMQFNPDMKPINKYRLPILAQLVRGKLQIVIEPHRNFWLEFDPANINLNDYLNIPKLNEEKVRARIKEYTEMEKMYILTSVRHSDYGISCGNPFLMKPDEKNIMLYVFEKYEDAASYVIHNPTLLPVLDRTFPIGVLDKNHKYNNLNVVLAIAKKMGATVINMDLDTVYAIGSKIEFFQEVSGYDLEVENLISKEDLPAFVKEIDGATEYRFPAIPFYNQENEFIMTDERRNEVIAHMENDVDNGLAFMAGATPSDMIVYMNEAATRFEKARTENNEEQQKFYNSLMNKLTIQFTELLCEEPFVYTLRNPDGNFTLKNEIAYLLITNRYEGSRNGEGRLIPAGVDNPQFMNRLYEASKVVAITDGPSLLCLVDTKLMGEAAKQWKAQEALREELKIYLTQGCGLTYNDAMYYYRRIKTDSNIFVEFTTVVKNGEYPSVGMIKVDGVTAKDIAETKKCEFYEAYNILLSMKLKENVDVTIDKNTVAESEVNVEEKQESDESKKGFFGKLFKK